MREDLIERLRAFVVERGKLACGSDIVSACNNSSLSLADLRALLAALEASDTVAASSRQRADYWKSEAQRLAAALEAAREDAGLWRQAFVNERARLNREHGMGIEQARIHAEVDAEIAVIDQARGKGVQDA